MKTRGVLLFVSLAAASSACLWDYDTLSVDAKQVPDMVDAIVGRFERNPPLYYEMRLERVSVELESHPDELNYYDDAAVACDRLGRSDEGLAWLARKNEALQRLDPEGKRSDDWYRYYANLGTLRVHRWAKDGMKKESVGELEQAILEIEKAIEINPNAHFGREWVQLGLMRTIYAYKTGNADVARGELLQMVGGRNRKELHDGFVGLVTLGAAWESVDFFNILASGGVLMTERGVEALAAYRFRELTAAGSKSAFENDAEKVLGRADQVDIIAQSESQMAAAYRALRANADEFHKNRTDFMLSRLRAGRHPDTDPKFWEGYVETERVDLRQFEPLIPRKWYLSHEAKLIWGVVLLSLPFVGLYVYNKRKRVLRERGKARSRPIPPPDA